MVTVRLLALNVQGVMFEADADVVMNSEFELNLSDLVKSLNSDFIMVLRVELPAHIFSDSQIFLIPTKTGDVTLNRRVPI